MMHTITVFVTSPTVFGVRNLSLARNHRKTHYGLPLEVLLKNLPVAINLFTLLLLYLCPFTEIMIRLRFYKGTIITGHVKQVWSRMKGK